MVWYFKKNRAILIVLVLINLLFLSVFSLNDQAYFYIKNATNFEGKQSSYGYGINMRENKEIELENVLDEFLAYCDYMTLSLYEREVKFTILYGLDNNDVIAYPLNINGEFTNKILEEKTNIIVGKHIPSKMHFLQHNQIFQLFDLNEENIVATVKKKGQNLLTDNTIFLVYSPEYIDKLDDKIIDIAFYGGNTKEITNIVENIFDTKMIKYQKADNAVNALQMKIKKQNELFNIFFEMKELILLLLITFILCVVALKKEYIYFLSVKKLLGASNFQLFKELFSSFAIQIVIVYTLSIIFQRIFIFFELPLFFENRGIVYIWLAVFNVIVGAIPPVLLILYGYRADPIELLRGNE